MVKIEPVTTDTMIKPANPCPAEAVLELRVENTGGGGRGIPKLTGEEVVKTNMATCGINGTLVRDKGR